METQNKPMTDKEDAGRREAAMAAALRDIKALASYPNAGIENADSTDMMEDLIGILEIATSALKIKSKPPRRRVVLRLTQGRVSLSWADRGVKVTLHDEGKAQTRIWEQSLKAGRGDRVTPWELEAPR